MGVVTYYNFGGELVGDSESGTYMRDALGSVTGTTLEATGAVQNTYRYKPYGDLLAKTGSAPDPKNQWVGTAGYRKTAIAHSASYVRARHLGNEEGMWTTVDPLWPGEMSYAYATSNPICLVDPTGEAAKNLDDQCYQNLLIFGVCDNWLAGLEITSDCNKKGSIPCFIAAATVKNPETGKCSGCCGICFPTCEESISVGGVLCSGTSRAAILKCAKESLRHLKPNKLKGKAPAITAAQSCPRTKFGGKCQPPGARLHITWPCVPKPGGRPEVISAVCCPCYSNGVVRIVCCNPGGCHT